MSLNVQEVTDVYRRPRAVMVGWIVEITLMRLVVKPVSTHNSQVEQKKSQLHKKIAFKTMVLYLYSLFQG